MRYLKYNIINDLKKKMVFLGGPRQVGKTTLSWHLLGQNATEQHPGYLSYDDPHDKKKIIGNQIPTSQPLIVLDEIHKYRPWRNLVKGLWDKNKSRTQILVTGSARLDYYRRGGDSLQGRYHYLRLHPFSLPELSKQGYKTDLEHLLTFGGFPEPLIAGDSIHWRRWQNERASRLIQEDLRDLETIKDLSLLEILLDRLPDIVGSPLSIQSLREDLSVAHETVARWITIFERLYACFRVAPYGTPKFKAVKKEQKLYMWDWSLIKEYGARFENLVACQLLKYCHLRHDTLGYKTELRYLRDREGREVDFVVIEDGKPQFAVECKLSGKKSKGHEHYFRERSTIPHFYRVHLGTEDYGHESIDTRVIPFATFCQLLDMP